MMNIVADKNIPYVEEAFSAFGKLKLLDGEKITREELKDCDALIIRTVTRVNEQLLKNTSVRFVGTVSSGTDHVDIDFLHSAGINFAAAPGSNANAVAEYVTAALLLLHCSGKIDIAKAVLGIVGVGHVGTAVAEKAKILGLKTLLNDPPKAIETQNPIYRPLDELMDCDIITLHVPLTLSGEYKTFRFFDAEKFRKMKKGVVVINSARGEVIDETALIEAIKTNKIAAVVIDVWKNEPLINFELLKLVEIGTPHIAGLSLESRTTSTAMIYEAFCKHFGLPCLWHPLKAPLIELNLPLSEYDDQYYFLNEIVRSVYDLGSITDELRKIMWRSPDELPSFFADFRKGYKRREFSAFILNIKNKNCKIIEILAKLGFKMSAIKNT